MFERYCSPASNAIFYARLVAALNGSPTIDSVDLLCGLMWESESRAQVLFRLHEIFPLHHGRPWKYTTLETAPESNPQLTDDAKRVLARAVWEADAARDYGIDTEHLLLGILGEKACLAAKHLAKAGVTLKKARRVVAENRASSPHYGPVSPWDRLSFKWGSSKHKR
jgi:ATP-dependent Clp protease ATP-binding subunit ClpA